MIYALENTSKLLNIRVKSLESAAWGLIEQEAM